MPTDSSVSVTKSRDKRSWFAEVSEAEKKLWGRIHTSGILDKDVKILYHKACCIYEKLFLSDNELPDLQNLEYLLWRLHYKHIDEFRKTLSQNSTKVEDNLETDQKTAGSGIKTADVHMEGFKLFLSEATKLYQDLIRRIKGYYGLLDEPWFYKNDGVSGRIETKRLHECQFACHRLCICLGDLARYLELYEKANNQQRNWSVAASYYLEAAKIYPDGGNPQNQLAVLATYIGDEFLALYHCIRSLAVNEPFPDALQNLLLLFERNRSSNIVYMSNEVYDFLKPSDWICSTNKPPTQGTSTRTVQVAENDASSATDLWTLFIRMTSFFFLDFNLDSFTCTIISTLRELEVLLALDVAKLSSALQSYQNMNLSKAGPYRALHITSVLLFIIHHLNVGGNQKIGKLTNETHQSTMMVKLALTITFTFMGRFVDRCLKGSPVVYFPLLPALLVFVEWLAGAAGTLDAEDEKCEKAMCYFFGSFVKLLNHLQAHRAHITSPDHVALWEDYELRGFIPLSRTHESLDFSSHWEEEINYKMKNEFRAHRIVEAAIKIAKRSSDSPRKWLFYSEAGRKFSAVEAKETTQRKDSLEEKSGPDFKNNEPNQQIYSGKTNIVDDEEDIVFKPIERHNSEPITLKDHPIVASSDESLRRASSLLAAQDRTLISCLTSPSATPSGSPSQPLGQNEYKLKGSIPSIVSEGPLAAGPPSLSSWVLNGERTKCNDTDRNVLKPIEEMASGDLRSLSLTTGDSFGIASPMPNPSSYCTPAPSAPLLPNTLWLIGNSDGLTLQTTATHEPLNFAGSSYASNIHQGGPNVPIFMDHSSPFLATMDSRPWSSPQSPELGNQNLQWTPSHAMHNQYYVPRDLNSMYASDASGFGLLGHWSYHDPLSSLPTMYVEDSPPLFHPSPSLLHGLHDQRRDMQSYDYQKPYSYVSPAVSDTRPEPQPLLQYLKQREWQLQQESQFPGSYMQN